MGEPSEQLGGAALVEQLVQVAALRALEQLGASLQGQEATRRAVSATQPSNWSVAALADADAARVVRRRRNTVGCPVS